MRGFLLGSIGALVWAQSWCFQPPTIKGLAQWRLYHLLPGGTGEATARNVLRLLLEDSVVRYVCYVYHVQLRYGRQGAWMVLDGEATEEGAYAFFHALRGAMDRFPQLLQSYVGLPGGEGEDWSQVAARLLWRDTLESPTALRLSQFFYEVWLGGKVHGVYWGRQGGHLRRFLPFVGQDSLMVWESYPWPEAPLSAQPLPAQGAMVFYTRWGVPTRSWASLLALWAHLKGLEAYLCEEKQLVCQFFWSPTPRGMEVWIYTSLPYATAQALSGFLGRSGGEDMWAVTGRFQAWQREGDAQLLLGQWLCLWRLGKYEAPSPRQLRQAQRKIQGVFFPVAL